MSRETAMPLTDMSRETAMPFTDGCNNSLCFSSARHTIHNYGLPIVYGRPYCNDAKEGVGAITPPKLNRG